MPMRKPFTKSRFGCRTCRVRKIRCDEIWPECHKCTSTGRKCDGTSKQKFIFVETNVANLKQIEPKNAGIHFTMSPLVSSYQLSSSERRAFDYFVREVGPCLAGSQDEPFWTYLVPQVCQVNTAVRSAVLAISCMFERPFEASQLHLRYIDPANQLHLRAFKWHSQSIKGFRDSLGRLQDVEQAEVALMSCVLLASIEYTQNNVVNASRILSSGYNITTFISTRSEPAFKESTVVQDILAPILARQTIHMAIFGYLPSQSWLDRFHSLGSTSTDPAATLSESRASLRHCLWKAVDFLQSVLPLVISPQKISHEKSQDFHRRQQGMLDELTSWHCSFELLKSNNVIKLTSSDSQAGSAMLLYFHVAYTWVTTSLDITHMHHDRETHHFERIIEHAEEVICANTTTIAGTSDTKPPSFTFEMGVIPPLFFAGWRCRHPLLRRKCVELLQHAPKQEGLFVAEWQSRAVEEIIKLEESDELRQTVEMGKWDGMTMPSEEMRCQHVSIHHEDHEGRKVSPRLICVRKIRKGGFDQSLGERLTIELY